MLLIEGRARLSLSNIKYFVLKLYLNNGYRLTTIYDTYVLILVIMSIILLLIEQYLSLKTLFKTKSIKPYN
jgi:hypothetical protein